MLSAADYLQLYQTTTRGSLILFQKQKLLHVAERSRAQPVEIHTACELACVEDSNIPSWPFLFVHKCCNFPTQNIKHFQRHKFPGRRLIVDLRRRVKWVGIVW